jgi:hypothetical protein
MRFGVNTTPKERSTNSDNSGSQERFQSTSKMANDAVNQLQAQLNDLQTVMRQQNDMIGNLQAAARAQALANTNNHHQNANPLADEVMKQFVKLTVKFYKDVNPRNPKLAFDGSNYTKWENAIDRTLQHAFVSLRDAKNKVLLATRGAKI